MSIFASQVTATHEFTCAPGQSFTVRKLSATELAETQKLYAVGIVEWATRVIQLGLTGWTYPDPLPTNGLGELVDEAVDQITKAVLKLTKPSAFLTTPESVEAAEKND